MMSGLLTVVLILTGSATNLWLMVRLMHIVKLASAIQMAWSKAEGMAEAIPWLPLFVVIPVAAIIGTIFISERYLKLRKAASPKRMLGFAVRVWTVQLLAFALGEFLVVAFVPVMRTVALVQLVVALIVAIGLKMLSESQWGQRVLSEN